MADVDAVSPGLIHVLEAEFRDECRNRRETERNLYELVRTLEKELRDEKVSRRTAERRIVRLFDELEGVCARVKLLETKVTELIPGGLGVVETGSAKEEGGKEEGKLNITPPATPTLRVTLPSPRLNGPIAPPSPLITTPPSPRPKGIRHSSGPNSPPPLSLNSSGLLSPPSTGFLSPTGPLSPPSPSSIPADPFFYAPPSNSPSPSLSPSPSPSPSASPSPNPTPTPAPTHAPPQRALSTGNLQALMKSVNEQKSKSDEGLLENGSKADEEAKAQPKKKNFGRKIANMLSPPSSPSPDTSPKNSRKSSPARKSDTSEDDADVTKEGTKEKEAKEDKESPKESVKEGKERSRMEKAKSHYLSRTTSMTMMKLGRIKSFPVKSTSKPDLASPPPSLSVFGSIGVADDLCVKAIKEITTFLKNYVHLPPSDLFQAKPWSEQVIFLKEQLQAGSVPDFVFKYQHDPHSVAQFLYEILAASERGILAKVGQGLVDSVEIDLEEYPELRNYKLSLLHSLVFLVDEDPHFALFYTLDLLRSFFRIRPESSLSFFGAKFGPVMLKEFPDQSATTFAMLLANFNAILEAKEDINFVVKDGRQMVHAASLERLFEKLLDPYYRDPLFVDTIFLTYDYFITSDDMLNKFVYYYWVASSGIPLNWKTQLSIRVLAVIKMWIMTHEANFARDDHFLSLLRTFVDSVASPGHGELSFFRYFAALAYHDEQVENERDTSDSGVDLGTKGSSGDLTEFIDDLGEEDGEESKEKGKVSFEERKVAVMQRSSSESRAKELALQTKRRSVSESSTLAPIITITDSRSRTPSPPPPTLVLSSAPPSPSSDSAASPSPSPTPPETPGSPEAIPTLGEKVKKRGALNRSSSASNLFSRKPTPLSKLKNASKHGSSGNLFSFTRSNSSSPTPTESSAHDASPPSLNPLSSSLSPSTSPNPSPKHNNFKKATRNRGNSDDPNVLSMMSTSQLDLKQVPPAPFSPFSTEPSVIAIHMAVIDQSLLRQIPYTEWLHKAFVSQELSPNFHNMVAKFNDWGRWVCTEVLRRDKVQDRVAVVTYFVDIIKHSVAINNFNAAAALIGGLSHSSVSRLKTTWEKLPAKVKEDFTKMTTLFEMGRNYKNYREAVKICKPPVIPYLALIPKDLIAIEEGNPTILDNGLINFHKLRLLAKLVKYVSQIQQPLYVHPQDPVLQDYLRNKLGGSKGLLTEKEMVTMSTAIQPLAIAKPLV